MRSRHTGMSPRALRKYGVELWFILAGAVGLPAVAEQAACDIRLDLDRGGWTAPGAVRPLGVGVPLREKQLREPAGLSLQTDDHRPIPAVFEVRRRYDDGSIQWLWIDFQAPAASHYRLRSGGENPLPSPGVRVADTGDSLWVDNGVLRLSWRKSGVTPCKVVLLTGATPENLVSGGDGAGVYLRTPDGDVAAMAGPGADLAWTVERANPLTAVLLVEGWYVRPARGQRVARGRVRFHIHWNQPWVKVDHTFIVTRSNDEITYAEIGIRWPLDAGHKRKARFGRTAREPWEVDLSTAEDAWIHQEAFPVYHKKQSLCRAGRGSEILDEGKEASGWCALHNGQAGMLVAVRDFAPQFPKELTAGPNGIAAKLWSGRGGRVLDYRPKTLIQEWWGDWFHRIMETYCRNGLPADLQAKEAWATYNPPCLGVARSHELLLAVEYLLRGTQPCKDAILLAQQALLPAFRAAAEFTSTQPDMLVNSMIGMWRVTGDETLKSRIRELHRTWTNADDPAGVSVKFFNHWAGTHYANPLYKLDRKVNAIVEYAQVLGDESDRRLALKAALALAPQYRTGTEPISYCNLSAAACGSAYAWQQNPELLATVTYQLETARKLFLAFEKLPPAEKGVERWMSRAKFGLGSYESHFTFPELNLVANAKDRQGKHVPLRLNFTVSSAAAPLLSLPVAIGVMSAPAAKQP